LVTVAEVRTLLDEIPSALIADSTIQACIDIASVYIDQIKRTDADSTLVEKSKLMYSAYLAVISYSVSVEKATGVLPAELMVAQRNLLAEADKLIKEISVPIPTTIVVAKEMEVYEEDG